MLQLVDAPASAETALIDLGDLSDIGEPLDDRGPADRALRWRARVEGLAAIALLAVFVLAGSVAPSPPPVGLVRSMDLPAGRFAVIGDILYASSNGRLVAESLATGERLWRSDLELREDFTVIDAGATVLISAPEHGWRTSAVDVATGVRRWQFAGVPLQADPVRRRVVMSLPARIPAHDNVEVSATIAVVDLDSGRNIWSYPPAGTVIRHLDVVFEAAAGGRQDVAAVVNTVGQDLLVDLTTGRGTRLPAVHDTDTVVLVSSLLLVVAGGPVNGELRAYDRSSMSPQWMVSGDFDGAMARCGPWLCATTVFGGTVALDPATGQARWRLAAATVRSGPNDRAVVLPTRSGGQGYVGVVQPSTGRMLTRLDGWQALRPQFAAMLPVLRPHPDGQVELAVLDTQRLVSYQLGRFRAVYAGASQPCASSATYLVCRTDGEALVWRIGPARPGVDRQR